MRASRETELAKEYPIHVVTAWLGNTPRIALKHSLQVTGADFEQGGPSNEEGRHTKRKDCGAVETRRKGRRIASGNGRPRLAAPSSCDSWRSATRRCKRT